MDFRNVDEPLVSIIVPTYNVERYISECINSLINQTYSNIEIVCVDDGSLDNTFSILEQYQANDSRIKLIKQENQFAGVARNNGMKHASGKYLLFVDSDDFCERNMIEYLVNVAEENNSEIVVFDLFRYDDKEKKILNTTWKALHPDLFGSGIKSSKDIAESIFQFTISGPMNKLFLREFIIKNNIWFQNLQRTNDLFFVYASLTYAERIAILDKKMEYYRINNSSSLQATNHISPFNFLDALRELKKNMFERNVYEIYAKSFKELVLSVSLYNLSVQKRLDSFQNVLEMIYKTIINEMEIDLGVSDCTEKKEWLEKVIKDKDNIVIYGAGTLAELVIKYLLWIKHIDMKKIGVVVTNKSSDMNQICGIEVNELADIKSEVDCCAFIVAINDKKSQLEILDKLQRQRISNTISIDYNEMFSVMIDNM